MNTSCCDASKWFRAVGIGVVLCGFFVAGTRFASHGVETSPPLKLLADSSARGEKVSTATGLINNDIEGLYILDHESGQLYCTVVNPRTGLQIGFYSANVRQALALERDGEVDFAMVTGFVNSNEGGRAGNERMASSVCYVTEGVTGRVAAFGLAYNPSAMQRNVLQQGNLIKIWDSPIREQKPNVPAADVLPGEENSDEQPAGDNAANPDGEK